MTFTRPSLAVPRISVALMFFALVLAAAFCGAVIGLGSKLLTAGIFGILLVPFIIFLPLDFLLILLLPLVYLFVGQLQYFGGLSQALWLPYALFGGLLFRLPFEALRAQRAVNASKAPAGLYPWMLAMLAVFVTSAVMNRAEPIFVLVGAKSYLLPLVLMASLLLVGARTRYWNFFWQGIPWLCMAQVPLVFYQHFVVAKRRSDSLDFTQVSWDAVVGSFGGNQDGGGASGALALFLVFAVFAILAMWKSGEIRSRLALPALMSIVLSILLAEIKVVFVLLPVAALYYYRRDLIDEPLKAVAALLMLFLLVGAAFFYYNSAFWSGSGSGEKDSKSALEYVFKAEGDVGRINYRTGEVSRLGAALVWWDEVPSRGDMLHASVGYGPAATRISRTVGMGDAARKYRFNLTTHSISTTVWDLGFAGIAVLLGILSASVWRATFSPRLAGLDVQKRQRVRAAGAGLLCVIAGLLYNADAVDNSSIQVLWVSLAAYISIALASSSAETARPQDLQLRA